MMTNVLIRGVSDEAIERIDNQAAALGLSRNEFLRRKLEGSTIAAPKAVVTAEDWDRSAELFADLSDPDVMNAAWQ